MVGQFSMPIDNPDRVILGRLLHAWHKIFKGRSIMLREAIEKANEEMLEVFNEINEDQIHLNRKKLGKWISKHAGRIVDGLKFELDDSIKLSAQAWRVVSI